MISPSLIVNSPKPKSSRKRVSIAYISFLSNNMWTDSRCAVAKESLLINYRWTVRTCSPQKDSYNNTHLCGQYQRTNKYVLMSRRSIFQHAIELHFVNMCKSDQDSVHGNIRRAYNPRNETLEQAMLYETGGTMVGWEVSLGELNCLDDAVDDSI